MALGFTFNVHYHGLDGAKYIEIRLSAEISCMHFNMISRTCLLVCYFCI